VDITFSTKRLEKECTEEAVGIKKYGPNCARKLRARLSDLEAAESLNRMRTLPGRLHQLTGNLKGVYSLDLEHPLRLLLEPDHDPPKLLPDGGTDEQAVTTIRIIGIEDTH